MAEPENQDISSTPSSSPEPPESSNNGSAAAAAAARPPARPPRRAQPVFPVAPTLIQRLRRVKGVMNHSYRDFSQVPPPEGYVASTKIEDMTFPQKIHHMLSQAEYQDCITWLPHGRSFKVTNPRRFEMFVCPEYFGHRRYSSFLRSLSNHRFKHISKGDDRNCKYISKRERVCL